MTAVRAIVATALATVAHADDAARHFSEKVAPLLESRCVSCHGAEKQKGGLRLDSREAAAKGGDTGPGFVAGKPGESLIIRAVHHETEDIAMPPKEKLSSADIAALERWVRDGALWPEGAKLVAPPPLKPGERIGDAWSDKRNPIVRIFGGQRLDLWSLRPVARQSAQLPVLSAQLEKVRALSTEHSALSTSPRTLARRLHFDLTGLPPSAEEVAAFEQSAIRDPQSAIAALADKLLSQKSHGEHWARMWLDVVRYSDSNGYDWDEFRPRAWRFRDYVVRSLNADKPFDRFITEQLAGDELLDGPPRDAAEQDALIATGYLRLGPTDNAAQLFNEQDRARHEWLVDLTETTGSAFLGLTLSCCRCHDHKTDPLSHADHYRMRAFFEPVKAADELTLDLPAQRGAIAKADAEREKITAPLQKERDAILAVAKERAKAKDDEAAKAALTAAEKKRREELKKQIDAANKDGGPVPTLGLLATDKTDKIGATRVLYAGDHKAPREEVVPGFISALDPNPANITPGKKTSGRRLALAKWIASPENPLTARVIVNRVWQQYFGEGLVATPNDFGFAGVRPSDAVLLDALAAEFMRGGWSLKKLHRLIVTSPRYMAARAPRRLSAEQLRDSMLAVSGLLKHRDGGNPVWPELPAEVLQANPAFLDDNETRTKGWYPSPTDQQNCRSLYLVQKRTVRVPFMETFDLPENSTSCARRNESVVAPQALALLNSPLTAAAAKAFAARVEREGDRDAQVRRVFSLALQRAPSPAEAAVCARLLEKRTPTELCRALLNVNEFLYVD